MQLTLHIWTILHKHDRQSYKGAQSSGESTLQIMAHNITTHQVAKNTAATEALLNLDILK